ncbi:hypothetical protein TWF696_005654 [Orbilia brochopaga]|uniref:Uncharacterized protein n=1 Tax=Orbilia brochopaga TaxID=3140254 RepID=A0AAV9V1D2_9PEZI
MANKNNPNRPNRSKSKARPKTKPSQTLKRISKATAAGNSHLSSKKSRKLNRNKAYVAQRILDEAASQGGDVLMKDEIMSRRKEKMIKNLQANKNDKDQKEAVMDVSDDL